MEKKSAFFIWAVAVLLDLFVGLVDYFTGYEIGLSVFYLAPIAVCVWFIGRRAGVLMSALSMVTMAVSMYMAGYAEWVEHRGFLVGIWALSVRLSFYLVVVFLLASLRRSLEEQKRLVLELRRAFDEIKTLSGFLPICSCCKKIRDDKGYWNQLERYISKHSDAKFSHGLCPECAEKIYPEYFNKKGRARDYRASEYEDDSSTG